MDGMTFTMDILQKVKIGKTVSKLTKMQTQFPMYPECKQIATIARYVVHYSCLFRMAQLSMYMLQLP